MCIVQKPLLAFSTAFIRVFAAFPRDLLGQRVRSLGTYLPRPGRYGRNCKLTYCATCVHVDLNLASSSSGGEHSSRGPTQPGQVIGQLSTHTSTARARTRSTARGDAACRGAAPSYCRLLALIHVRPQKTSQMLAQAWCMIPTRTKSQPISTWPVHWFVQHQRGL